MSGDVSVRSNRPRMQCISGPRRSSRTRGWNALRVLATSFEGLSTAPWAFSPSDWRLESNSDTADQRGSLALLGESAVGRIFMLAVVVSLLAYSGWGLIRAVYDPLHRGSDPAGIASRIGFAWSGLNYAALAVFAAGLLLGGSKSTGGDAVQKMVGWALQLPAGATVVTVAGVIGILGGLGQFAEAYKAGFRKDLKRNQMTRAQRLTVDGLGGFGMVARGVIFGIVGIFVLVAGLHRDAGDAHSFGPAFAAVAREPLGHVLLAIVALGFIALGLHSWANARWVRMPAK